MTCGVLEEIGLEEGATLDGISLTGLLLIGLLLGVGWLEETGSETGILLIKLEPVSDVVGLLELSSGVEELPELHAPKSIAKVTNSVRKANLFLFFIRFSFLALCNMSKK